jgi:type II restriction enzyme
MNRPLQATLGEYKSNPESVYNTWFVNNVARLKAFRTIRRGVQDVVQDIKRGSFGNDFKGSSLEFVLTCITEQRQVFAGAAHAFYWKPKLRIPDIYENDANKRAFGQFLERCFRASKEEQVIEEIIRLDQRRIKGLGPAVANILYFLHPTIIPPFNTAIVNGFNQLFADKVKLGSWSEYLRMREVIIEQNKLLKAELSTDLGAFAGLLFEVGEQTISLAGQSVLSDEEWARIKKKLKKRQEEVRSEDEEDALHTEMQYHLLTIGEALGYDVICAANDRSRCHHGQSFSFIGLPEFPYIDADPETRKTITLIDVVWFEKGTNVISCSFEVEKSTSIYSGILRLKDLYHSCANTSPSLFLVIPDRREREVVSQLTRPSIRSSRIEISYILFSDLRTHCEAICRFGEDKQILKKIARIVA